MAGLEAKREMEAAVKAAWANPNAEASMVPRKGDIPTIDEFAVYTAKQAEKE